MQLEDQGQNDQNEINLKTKDNLEFNVGEKKFLGVKRFRINDEFPVFRRKYQEGVNFREEDNKDMFLTDRHFNKLKYDILQLPDLVTKYDKDSNFFKYNYKEQIRSFKPIVTNVNFFLKNRMEKQWDLQFNQTHSPIMNFLF